MAEIYFLEWDSDNETHLAEHGIQPRDVREMLSNDHITRPNPRGGENRVLLTGKTNGGRVLTISLEATNDPGTWRPVTGYPAPEPDIKLLSKYVR